MLILVEGWYPCKQAKPVEEDEPVADVYLSSFVLEESFTKTIRQHLLENLAVTSTQRLQGSVFNPTYVRGIANLAEKGALFYIEELKVPKLQALLSSLNRQQL